MDVVALGLAKADAKKNYAPIGRVGLGNHVAFLGDSLTAGSVINASRLQGFAWPLAACSLSGGVLRPVLVDGFPGQRSDQILPFLYTDILTLNPKPHACVVAWGTNDILQNTASITVPQNNIRTAVTDLRAAGIKPVLATVPPNNTTATHGAIGTFNAWLKRYAAANQIPLLDFHTLLVDPANGNYSSTYNNDGTHPNSAGYLAMGQLASNVLTPLCPAVPPLLTAVSGDPLNRLGNSLFLTDANADGIPDSWGTFGGGSGFTHSLVSGDTSILGNWAQVACAASASDRVMEFNSTSGWSVGDVLLVGGRFSISGYSSGTGLTAKITFTGNGSTAYPLYQWKVNTSGSWYQLLTIPAGTTALLFDFIFGAGTGTYRVAQPTLYSLTATGLLNP